jgi:hypothetical protein
VSPATFLPVRVVDAMPTTGPDEVEIVLAGGDRLVLRGAPMATLLAQAVAVLRRAC